MLKVSVILTTYNSESFIEKTTRSILNQKGAGELFEIELIVVDDCSTDNSIGFLIKNNIKYLQTTQNSGGPNKGRNIGIKASTGDYICIADHDDEWFEDRIISLLPYLQKAPIVTSGYVLKDISTEKEIKRVQKTDAAFLFYEKNATFFTKLTKSLKGQLTYLGSIIYSSELKHVLFEEHFGMVDYDWILRLFHNNTSVEVPKVLYRRFVDGANLSLNERYRTIDFYYSLMFIENYRDIYPKDYIKAYNRIHGTRARYYYQIGKMKIARFYFLKSEMSLKTLLYYLTSFVGSGFVKKRFNVFG